MSENFALLSLAAEIAELKELIRNQQLQPTPSGTSGFFTLHQAAERLGLKPNTVYQLSSKGKLKSHSPGGKVLYFSEEALREYALGQAAPAPVPAPKRGRKLAADTTKKA